MSSNEFSSRDKFRPRPLDQIDSQASFSKENTEKSMQGSFYDCDITSLNTLGLSSPRSRTRRNESISSKSKISSRNMLEFEEFILDNPTAELSKRGYLLDTVINNTMDHLDKEKDRERTFDSHNKTLPTEILNDDYLLGSDILPTIRKDDAKSDGLAPLFPIMAGLDTHTVHETVETENNHQKNVSATIQQSTNDDSVSGKMTTTEGGYRYIGDVSSDYIESFDESHHHSSGVRKKEEISNTKKLDDSQDVQIKTMLKSCNALRAENDFLRKSLSIAKNHSQNEQRFDYKNKENCKDLERVVAMKGMNFYMQELEYRTEMFRKELQSRNRIIQELQKELDLKDYEIDAYKKKRENERLTQSINVPDSTRLPKTSMADHRQCKSTHRDSSMEFQTPSRPQLRGNKFNNLEEQNELVKVFTATRGVSDQVSPSDMKYIQHMADISEKLDEIKRKEKQVSKKESKKRQEKSENSKQYQSEYGTVNAYMGYTGSSQLIKYRTNNNEKSTKNRDFSPYASASASEHNKISRQGGGLNFEEGSLEEGRISSSLAEAIFEHHNSAAKDISRRDIEEFSPFNMSPAAKGKIYMGGKEERHNKKTSSNAASQNVSRVNEMSMINETLSENYVTESIHNRLAYELQKQLGASSKFKNKELKNFGKAPREDFMGKTYEGIEKVHQTIQNQKRKISSSTPGSRADTVEKGLKDSITHKENPATIHYESSSSKWKDNYYTSSAANLPSKSENASLNILKTSNLNILKPSTINPHDLKPNKTPSNYDKSGNNEPYTKLYGKGSEKKTRSATTSQDKIVRKSKDKYDHKYMGKTIEGPFGYSHPSNETMLSINSSVDRMFDKNSHFRSHHSLEREQKFMQTQPYHRNEIINEVDDLSPLPIRSESHHGNNKHSKLSTAPLSSYLKLARSGKNLESSSAALSRKTNNNISDLENKENRLDSNPRPNTTSTTKGSKRTLFSTESNTEMRNNYASNLDKLTTISLRAGLDSSKGSGSNVVQKKSSGNARHQTPTTKVHLDAPSQGTSSKAQQSKSGKTKDKDLDEVNLSALENSRLNNSRARSSSNKNNSKNGTRNLQGMNNYPVYNNLMMNNGSVGEYGHSSQGSKKAALHHSSLEHRSYDATYQNEREMMKKNKEDYLESSVGSRDTYTGQFLAKNRRESYKPYNLYSYDSKKY